jgi:hypothetical protein
MVSRDKKGCGRKTVILSTALCTSLAQLASRSFPSCHHHLDSNSPALSSPSSLLPFLPLDPRLAYSLLAFLSIAALRLLSRGFPAIVFRTAIAILPCCCRTACLLSESCFALLLILSHIVFCGRGSRHLYC